MAKIPTPRSYNQILGDMVDAFLSRFGLKALKIGSPVLSVLESSAQSDLRSSQDIFDLLNAQSLERATGVALDRIGLDEDLERRTESPASGLVTVSDTSFTKISSKIYQGQPAPIIGSSSIYVTDASAFPASGSVYLGRNTNNYEGPLAYTSKTNNGTYWTLNLSSTTRRFHNLGETVILAQGGNRTINAGTLVQTPQGNTSDAVKFATVFAATVPDGETELTGIQVQAQAPGVGSNVSAGAISAFVTPPFTGAAVTNPLPFTNGLAAEDDKTFRERIKAVRQSRSKGTSLAIQTAVTGITSTDENKRVSSASVVTRQGYPTTLYIDDGTGYEEKSVGVAIEPLIDSAYGGEQFFQIASARPVSKAFAITTNSAPFALSSGAKLAVKIGGIAYEHTFSDSEFRSITSASAYEVAASINADSTLGFSASTSDSGTRVRIFAKADVLEDLEVVTASGTDANLALLFPKGRVDTMLLYKNDRLLSKDGRIATVTSKATSFWGALASGVTLQLAVDGTPAVTYTFVDQDFIDAKTGYTTVGRNSVAAWAAVFNAKIPGITATESNGLLVLTSNSGASSRAKIDIQGGTLVTPGQVFVVQVSTGDDSDYTLDRQTGQIRLETPLSAGDSLSAGTIYTRAFLESQALGTVSISGAGGKLWFTVDGNAKIISTGLNGGTSLATTITATPAWGARVRVTAGTSVFSNLAVGDWVIIWDANINAAMRGIFRIVNVTGTYFEIERRTSTGMAQGSFNLATLGMVFVRADAVVQQVPISTLTNHTASSLVGEINNTLAGAMAKVFKTNKIRVNTKSYALGGDIALVATDTDGALLKIAVSDAVENLSSHLASVASGNTQAGTPDFTLQMVTASSSGSNLTVNLTSVEPQKLVVGLRTLQETYNTASPLYRFGHNLKFVSPISDVTNGGTTLINLRLTANEWVNDNRIFLAAPFAFGSQDDITVVADQDTDSRRFTVPLYRRLVPVGGTYGTTNTFRDKDNGSVTLATAFGLGYDFNDFAVFMAARALTHSGDATKSILWRYNRLGPDGNVARLRYVYPDAASQLLKITTDPATNKYTNISVALPSGAVRTGYTVRAGTKVGTAAAAAGVGMSKVTYLLGYPISTASRTTNVTTATLTLPSGVTDHGLIVGNAIWMQSTSGSFTSGLYTITARTATTISYADTAADVGATATPGTVSFDSTGEANFTGASIATGDIIRIDTTSGLPAAYEGLTLRIDVLGNQYIQAYVDGIVTPAATPTWNSLGDTTSIKIYQLDTANCTATAIAAKATSLADAANTTCPVRAVITGAGNGTILKSSSEEALVADTWFSLSDGINYVKTTTSPGLPSGDYQFLFKNAINAGLATGTDWANEDVRLVPLTTKNLSTWLNTLTVTGLSSVCTVEAADQAQRLQITSQTPGSNGSVQVQGGTGNSGSASVSGSAALVTDPDTSTYAVVTVRKADAQGMVAGQWLSVNNSASMPKSVFTSATDLDSIASNGVFVLDSSANTPVYTIRNSPVTSKTWQIEKQGKFTCFRFNPNDAGGPVTPPTLSAVIEGDWVRIVDAASKTTNAVAVSTVNQGIFRVVRIVTSSGPAFWIENANSIDETVEADITFFSFDSLMPGDKINIGTTLWNTGNMGIWTVESVGDVGNTGDKHNWFANSSAGKHTFKVSISDKTPVAVVAPGPGALGTTEVKLMQVTEAQPTRLIKRIRSISPNPSDGTYVDIKFDTSPGYALISSTAGSVISNLDKLGFNTDLALGIDGYSRTTGLIAEANRVVYGDPRDPAAYPGEVAAGASLDISGPLVKRITCALNLRVRSGVSTVDVANGVRSAVASVINQTGIGKPIAISDLITAASRVNGVIAVSVVSPTFNSTSDLISVQPYEKPLVLSLEQDVQISFAGE